MKTDNKKQNPMKYVVMISQIGISMMVPIFLCLWFGLLLDEKLGTSWIAIAGIFIGIVTSFRNVYLLTKKFYSKDKKNEENEWQYIENLKKAGERNRQKSLEENLKKSMEESIRKSDEKKD